MFISFLQRNKFFRNIIYVLGKLRAHDMIDRIKPLLNKNDSILDIGAGSCNISEILEGSGYNVFPLDIQNLSFVDGINPIIYDGITIPFDGDSFDKSLLLTVLHHTPNPEEILDEAKRVSKNIIVIEDIYSNWFHRYITYFFDSLLNLEFFGHPHTNKTDYEWRTVFKNMNLILVEARYKRSFLIFRHATYFLTK